MQQNKKDLGGADSKKKYVAKPAWPINDKLVLFFKNIPVKFSR